MARSGQAPSASELESHLGYWLRFVSNHVSNAFKAKVEAAGVSVSEWVVLRQLYAGQLAAAGAIAEAIGMTKGAVSKVVARLEEKRLLQRSVLEDDRRQQGLALTAKGRELVPELARLADENDAEFFGHLSKPARAELLATLRELVHHHGLESVPVD
ncbi:MAG TPA: MarR family winged helix-turn-helix transcriptional regulator [Polyangiaceae bacterium]|nr:MarR family winged helix-turn-helix transcriptional regulator [Polyangiaceae bacterium]